MLGGGVDAATLVAALGAGPLTTDQYFPDHTGLVHSFGRPVRPRRLSFQLRVNATSELRSFFNMFFSSQTEQIKNERLFWAGDEQVGIYVNIYS